MRSLTKTLEGAVFGNWCLYSGNSLKIKGHFFVKILLFEQSPKFSDKVLVFLLSYHQIS